MLIDCQSRITAVAVHARGALVTRQVVVPDILPDAEVRLAVRGITLLAEPGSLRASVGVGRTGRTLSMVRSELVFPDGENLPGESRALLDDLDAQRKRAEAEHAQLVTRRDQLARITVEPSLRPTVLGPSIESRTQDALACSEALSALLADLDARALSLEAEIDALGRKLHDARAALHQRELVALDARPLPTRTALLHVQGTGPIGSVELTYAVPAARWWPVYTLRLTDSARQATWVMEALVAQRTREDWSRAALSLSTADLLFDARLPELPSLRLGRAQSPVRKGYRAPPPGLDRMFEGYDRAAPPAPPKPRPHAPEPEVTRAYDEGEMRSEIDADDGPMKKHAAAHDERMSSPRADLRARMKRMEPAAAAAPMPQPSKLAAPMEDLARTQQSRGGGGAGPWLGGAAPEADEAPIEPSDAWLDFDALVLDGPDGGATRGRLTRRSDAAVVGAQREAARALDRVTAHLTVTDPAASRGMFDQRYAAQGRAEIPSDGALHRVAVASAEAKATARWRTAPGVTQEVFREVELTNPFATPLLAGPVEVFADGSLLTVASIDRLDRGGSTHVGMGVDPRIKVARNARMHEESAGLLSGTTVIEHHVAIELSAPPGLSPVVDVIDRIPVSDDKSVEVALVTSRPEARGYKQSDRGAPVRGGLRWSVSVPAGAKASVEFHYRVTLPSKTEIVGGNRRD